MKSYDFPQSDASIFSESNFENSSLPPETSPENQDTLSTRHQSHNRIHDLLSPPNYDADLTFLLQLLPDIRNFDDESKSIFKLKVMKLIHKLKYKKQHQRHVQFFFVEDLQSRLDVITQLLAVHRHVVLGKPV